MALSSTRREPTIQRVAGIASDYYRDLFENDFRDGHSVERLAWRFVVCVVCGSVLSDEMREIGFNAVLEQSDLLEIRYKGMCQSVGWNFTLIGDAVQDGSPDHAGSIMANILSHGAETVALATVQPEIFMPMVFDWNVAMWPYREQLQAWREHPELVAMRSRACDAIRNGVWWLQ